VDLCTQADIFSFWVGQLRCTATIGFCLIGLIEGLCERTKHVDIFLFFLPIIQWCSISDVLFTGGRGVSDFSVLKYY